MRVRSQKCYLSLLAVHEPLTLTGAGPAVVGVCCPPLSEALQLATFPFLLWPRGSQRTACLPSPWTSQLWPPARVDIVPGPDASVFIFPFVFGIFVRCVLLCEP